MDNQSNIMAVIYIWLITLFALGFYYVRWSALRRSLRGVEKTLQIGNEDHFLTSVRYFLNARLSADPNFSVTHPASAAELHAWFKKWREHLHDLRKTAALALVIQLIAGTMTIKFFSDGLDLGLAITHLLSGTALVLMSCILPTLNMKQRLKSAIAVEQRLESISASTIGEQAGEREGERAWQAYRLQAIASLPAIVTDEDVRERP